VGFGLLRSDHANLCWEKPARFDKKLKSLKTSLIALKLKMDPYLRKPALVKLPENSSIDFDFANKIKSISIFI
jgi:hypothetical protein